MNKLFTWVRTQSMKVKALLGVMAVLSSLVALKLLIKDQDNFFVASEAVHFLGLIVLIYKLSTQKTCSGDLFSIPSSTSDFWVLFLFNSLCYTFQLLDEMKVFFILGFPDYFFR